MKLVKTFVLSLIIAGFAVTANATETGVCTLLTMEYTKALPAYTQAKREYDDRVQSEKNRTASYAYQGYVPTADLKKVFDAKELYINKIWTGLKTNGCYTQEDMATVQNLLK